MGFVQCLDTRQFFSLKKLERRAATGRKMRNFRFHAGGAYRRDSVAAGNDACDIRIDCPPSVWARSSAALIVRRDFEKSHWPVPENHLAF